MGRQVACMHLLDAQAVLIAHADVKLAPRLALLGRELGVLKRTRVILAEERC